MPFNIHVDAYSGYKANERPLRFRLDGETHEIAAVVNQWYSPDGAFFRIRTTAGKHHTLRCDPENEWSIV